MVSFVGPLQHLRLPDAGKVCVSDELYYPAMVPAVLNLYVDKPFVQLIKKIAIQLSRVQTDAINRLIFFSLLLAQLNGNALLVLQRFVDVQV